MKTHRFEPYEKNPKYCGVMEDLGTRGNPAVGFVSMSAQCGYPRSAHQGCQDPKCPDFGDPDYGEGTCPESHAPR